MRIVARGVDPATGETDRHGIPQIACPARRDEVNPQFTCRNCPCAADLGMHEAVDDLGQAFHLVDAADCTFAGSSRELIALWLEFPHPLTGVVEGVRPRVAPGVACPLLADPEWLATASVAVDGIRWAPESNCTTCQFHRGTRGSRTASAVGAMRDSPSSVRHRIRVLGSEF